MPKLKVHQSAAKRIKVTSTGKLMRRRAGAAHKLTHKSAARKRRLGRPADVAAADQTRMKRLMGI